MAIYEFKNITKSFVHRKKSINILNNLDITINKGKFKIIRGPSGSGKSSLLWILAGIDPKFDGRVISGENEVVFDTLKKGNNTFWRDDVSLIFQNHNLIPEWTALENCVSSMVNKNISSKEIEKRAVDTLESLGLKDRLDHLPRELSIGQRQRVSIARSIVTEPRVLLADEPTSGLDDECAKEIMGIFKELADKKDMAIIISSHKELPIDINARYINL